MRVPALLPGCSITAPRRASLMHAGTGGGCVSLEVTLEMLQSFNR